MGQYPRIRVKGAPRERGRQYGEQTRERIALSIEAYRDVFEHYAGWDWETVVQEATRFAEPIREYEPKYLAEIQGIAEGAGVQAEDILAINVRTEVMFAAKARDALARASTDGSSATVPAECSAFVALPAATVDCHTLIGQNWDWLLHCFDTVVVLEAEQDDGPNFVTVVEAGLLAKTGMNASGVGLVTNALVCADDKGTPGVPFHVLLRAILDATTLTDALVALQRGLRSSSANYLIAHVDGIAVDIEASPGDFSQLYLMFPNDGVMTHANHFESPSFDRKDLSMVVMPDSPFRLSRLRQTLAEIGPSLDRELLQGICADHSNHPLGICCHPDPRMDPHDQSATVASIIMDLDDRRLWLCDGYPCTGEFREIDYGLLLAREEQRDGPTVGVR